MSLVLRNVSFGYEAVRPVLRGVSVEFAPGAVTAIIGCNGAGKSTMLRLLAGLRRPTSGSATVGADEVAELSASERARRVIYLPQQSSVAFDYSVREVVAMGGFALSSAEGAADEALARVGLVDRASDLFLTLSAGQQQRVNLARAIAQIGSSRDEQYLLADEPVSAMDPHHAQLAMRLLKEIASSGVGVVVVLHDLSLVLRFADEVVLLGERGRIHSRGGTASVMTPGALEEIFEIGFEQLRDARGIAAAFVPSVVNP
ncbi:MAG: ABC transporter ATP-binding protein [Phycisphaeraceae bacterium]|nr:ABC transporter ATP-binding protein [Phycisphaeraceae bacterium]